MFGQDYVKNVKGNVVLKGNFGENAKAKSGTLYLYELLGQGEYLLDIMLRRNQEHYIYMNY